MNRAMVWVGGACAALGLICCFTALLPIILGGLGLTGVLTVLYQDAVLVPLAVFGFVVAGLGLVRLQRAARN